MNKRGVSGTPLAYLIRNHVEPNEDEDEGFGEPTFTKELIAGARPDDYADYSIDNNYLWTIIRKMTQNGFAWTWVKDQSRSCDGRLAFQQLKRHYLGDSFLGKIKSDANSLLERAFYDGKSKNFTYETYCEKVKRAFTDLEECGG